MEIRPVKGYEGVYEITELGGIINAKTGERLKARTNAQGYVQVNLHKDGKCRTHMVHRLVAEAFIPNPEDKPQVNHIDEDKENNRVSNLEWVTHQENCSHGTRNARITELACFRWARPVEKLINGEPVMRYASMGQAARLNDLKAQRIARVCTGERKTYAGYGWRYA